MLSVIIPTYNRAALLRETLESVFQQTFSDYEIIVVDDGSTDRTENALEQLVNQIGRASEQMTKASQDQARQVLEYLRTQSPGAAN